LARPPAGQQDQGEEIPAPGADLNVLLRFIQKSKLASVEPKSVYALDAATGKELWKFDPRADPRAARNPCRDLVNRGVAVWEGRVFVASVDGRLHSLDAKTGKELWSADTIIEAP
jgi:outer membrane protein assembly factor BamB